MNYTPEEVLQYVREEDVKFIRLAFCDVYGTQHNVAVMAQELERAFADGVAIDASAIPGFGGETRSDLLLRPDASTLSRLPWRPEQGGVAHLFCDITRPDGAPFEADCRAVLRRAEADAAAMGCAFSFGAEMEFYLFKLDETGAQTRVPFDQAGYMDIAPEDRGENVRREICLTLEQMGIHPESSHHESGPGQNEIDFRYAAPLKAADDAVTFRAVVRTVADRCGLWADFSPKPLPDRDGSGMHVNFSVRGEGDPLPCAMAGVLEHIREMTLFLNPCADSYRRLGADKAPAWVSWSRENRSQLIRLPAAVGAYRRAELRSPDSMANPYLAYALVIRAALEGVAGRLELPAAVDCNLYRAPAEVLSRLKRLPASPDEAVEAARGSAFLRAALPEAILSAYGVL